MPPCWVSPGWLKKTAPSHEVFTVKKPVFEHFFTLLHNDVTVSSIIIGYTKRSGLSLSLRMFCTPSQCWARPHQPVPTASCLGFKPAVPELWCRGFSCLSTMPCVAREAASSRSYWVGNGETKISNLSVFHLVFTFVCHLSTKEAVTSSYIRHKTKQNDLVLFYTASCRPNSSAKLHPRSQMIKQFHIPTWKSWCHTEVYWEFPC